MRTKILIKHFCKYVYYTGVGNYWFENVYPETVLYMMYTTVSFSIYTIMVFLEILAVLFGDFPEVEKKSATMFFAVHNIVLIKMYLILFHKKSIRKLNFEMAAVGDNLEEAHVMKQQYLKHKILIILYFVSVYLTLITYAVESARRAFVEGAPFYTVVTYLPYYDDNSTTASFFRVFFYITWLCMMLPMISADCLAITHLITMAFKFITLRHHFESIREEFDHDILTLNKKKAVEKLKTGFLEGIRMHQKLLYLADEIHRVFGIIMSLQVCESSAVAVLLLLRLALSPHLYLTNALMTFTFVTALFYLLALNLWNAGEITYQASLLSMSMFNSGWHLCELERTKDIRRLVLISCAQAQKTLILKAFGIQDLSYGTFVSVARMTYSIFAVFYKRKSN